MSSWNKTHGVYARFALLTFQTAVMTQQEDWTLFAFRDAFVSQHPTTKAKMNALAEKMTWEDSSYFELDDIRFFCRLSSDENIRQARSKEKLAEDREDLVLTVKVCCSELALEAQYLLKAMDFWERRHKDKAEEWCMASRQAFAAESERERLKALKESDEGYHSWEEDEGEEDEDEYEDGDGGWGRLTIGPTQSQKSIFFGKCKCKSPLCRNFRPRDFRAVSTRDRKTHRRLR
jgi:hypothetical protein